MTGRPWVAVRKHITTREVLRWARFRTLAEAYAWCETMTAGERSAGLNRTYWPVLWKARPRD